MCNKYIFVTQNYILIFPKNKIYENNIDFI